jgi:hypothetical protein
LILSRTVVDVESTVDSTSEQPLSRPIAATAPSTVTEAPTKVRRLMRHPSGTDGDEAVGSGELIDFSFW